MGRQLVATGMGVGGMAWGEGRFRDGLMLHVRQGIFQGMMAGIFKMTFTVFARPGFHCGFFPTHLFWRRLSGRHTQ